ncbi:MAG TPA: hypothetical protein DCE19_02780 [Gemmatimonadetes bacterium]|nr:hypothetical protein [Gemmatimonadota bacterium]
MRTILEDHPNFADVRHGAGLCLAMMGDTEGARREWELCAEQNPDDCRIKAYLVSLDS